MFSVYVTDDDPCYDEIDLSAEIPQNGKETHLQRQDKEEKHIFRDIFHTATQAILFPVYSIYALIDPTDQSIRYIGMSSQPEMRLINHLKISFGRKLRWIRGLQSLGLLPMLKIIETTDNKQYAFDRERYWIQFYARRHAPLLNGVVLHSKKRH